MNNLLVDKQVNEVKNLGMLIIQILLGILVVIGVKLLLDNDRKNKD
jgi:hypothetical protein